jgi:hypothetical protein
VNKDFVLLEKLVYQEKFVLWTALINAFKKPKTGILHYFRIQIQ